MLKIKGTQIGYDEEPEILEFITEGKLYEKGGAHYILYEESEISGMAGCKTTLKYTDSQLRMRRMGKDMANYTVLEFGEGHSFSSSYFTPYGPVEVEVKTNKFKKNFDEAGLGNIFVEYSLNLKGLVESKNTIDITVANNLSELQNSEIN